jgi:hypothetical protein
LVATAADIGLTRKQVHEARRIRDAEERDPGILRRSVPELTRGEDIKLNERVLLQRYSATISFAG